MSVDESTSEADVTTPSSMPATEGEIPPEEAATPGEVAPKRRLPGRLTVAIVAASALLVVALGVGLVVTTRQLHAREAGDRARVQATAAARSYAVELASYDYRHLDQDFGAVLAHATPSFAKSFTQSSNALKTVLTKYDATAKATVLAAGAESSAGGRAVVLVFLNQTVTNTTQKTGPTTDQSRLEITLLHVGGGWSIDQVRLL